MKIKHLVLSGIALLLGATVVGTAVAQQLTKEQNTVICRLKNEVAQQKGKGNKLVFLPLLGKVRQQVETPFRATLYPDIQYTFVGTCDENCKGLNLALKDMSGQVIATSETVDSLPVITFTPPSESEYQIGAKPGECTTTKGCNFGMGIFAPSSANVPNASKIPAELAQFQMCQ
ncbi:hypothetical protein PN499_16035 [Kamptonema animale CS-326]|jgi:hypothetical protein|uniref:hypothetical protein n=1 Tax=Kamptonema TaxID=1501433 RepID=UPI0001DAD504|nr:MULTISPECIES: hypothetical protein [Kamptonema]MDB9512699.1 hypothetical protein [Kamptonema animale CS-326]CBN57794.1 conserved exported hypothetical protein [Kamptonema sp. PCC 6506]